MKKEKEKRPETDTIIKLTWNVDAAMIQNLSKSGPFVACNVYVTAAAAQADALLGILRSSTVSSLPFVLCECVYVCMCRTISLLGIMFFVLFRLECSPWQNR